MRKRFLHKSANGRGGFTIVEISLVLTIATILIIAGIFAYKKILPSVQASSEFKKVNAVISGIERSKNTNGGLYIAATDSINNIPTLKNELGGDQGISDVKNWQYECTEGDDVTLKVTTDKINSDTVANLVAEKVNKNLKPWTAAVTADNQIELTLSPVDCRTP